MSKKQPTNNLNNGLAFLLGYYNELSRFLDNGRVEKNMSFWQKEKDEYRRNIVNTRVLTQDESFAIYKELNLINNRIHLLINIKYGKMD
jgi:hypothetical protein|tara:strand:- start:145 stop:411 length:267 start_codon:yes stop_codon:yes gene_type:complete